MSFGKKHFQRFMTGKKRFQGLFRKLHELSLRGMNVGGGDNVGNSGEKNVIAYLARCMPAGARPVIFDVGANIGIYAREVGVVFGDTADLYCFEPLKKAYAFLVDNMAGRPNTKTFNFGFGEKEGTALIHANEGASPLASCFDRKIAHIGIEMIHKEEIAVRRIDSFCREMGIGSIDLLKVDVEGGELAVLKGAGALIDAQAVRVIQFEFGPCHIDSRTFFKDFFTLLDPGYRIYRVLRDGFEPVDQYAESDEIFLTTNYMAIARKDGACA